METFDLGPKVKNGTRILFVSGDERQAKERVIDFIESLGRRLNTTSRGTARWQGHYLERV
jgi:predicted dinucleotide-binding enzyme